MSEKIVHVSGGGVSAATLLGVLFVVLKLTGYINWSWLWVLAPFWIPFALIFGVIFGAITLCLIVGGVRLLLAFIIEWWNEPSSKRRR